jgi:uncharacterized Rossmann fold enzyme
MVRRNLAAGLRGRFTVFTDRPDAFKDMAGVQTRLVPPGLNGWWNKLYLFSADAFPKGERVLYFDLDTCITGPLDAIAAYTGDFAILRDVYRPLGLQSSVMAWEAGNWTQLFWSRWESYSQHPWPGGDQEYIEFSMACLLMSPDKLQDLYPGLFRSYKAECQEFVPRGTSVVFFHGFPRPHQAVGWVKDVWKISDETMFFAMNVKEDQVRSNLRHALTKPKWIEMRDGTQYPALIVGGGPSLEGDLWRIRGWQLSGGVVFATNNTFAYLKSHGITPDAHVMHDARPENLAFVPSDDTLCYYASQCHPSVLDAAGDRLVCWHTHSETALDEIGDSPKGPTMVAGGSTIGLNALALAYILGHRQFMLFGFDSSYTDGSHHVYPQSLNDGELVLEAQACGQEFLAAPWMIQQSEQFVSLARQLAVMGCEITVYGSGLLPTIANNMEPVHTAADLRAKSLHEWLKDTPNPIGAEIGVFAGELSRKLLKREDLRLYLVDSWAAHHSEDYAKSGDFHASLNEAQQERYFRMTHHMVYFAADRAKIIRKDSREAAKDIPDGSLDFVFIDADHTYEGCKGDIEAWLPKVKKGGFISGHDYENTEYPAWGVKQAVDERFGCPEKGENFTWRVQV